MPSFILLCLLLCTLPWTAAAAPRAPLLPRPPASINYMVPPQQQAFSLYRSKAGYQVLLSRDFGSDPLGYLPDSDQYSGTMLLRCQSEQQLLAFTCLDPGDSQAFSSITPLPVPEDGRLLSSWWHSSFLTWFCRLSYQQNYHGDRLLLEAQAPYQGKTYQALFLFPVADYGRLLPQALYSLNSFKVLKRVGTP